MILKKLLIGSMIVEDAGGSLGTVALKETMDRGTIVKMPGGQRQRAHDTDGAAGRGVMSTWGGSSQNHSGVIARPRRRHLTQPNGLPCSLTQA